MDNKYKIDWDSSDNKEALINATVNNIIVKLFRDSKPDVVKKIQKLVRDNYKKP